MRPSSSRRPSGRRSDSPRRSSTNHVAETIYNPSLPSYAQATISHTQRATTLNGSGSIRGLKAGTGKTTPSPRPTSSKRYSVSSATEQTASGPSTPLKKRPSFVNIFRNNSTEGSPRDVGPKSPSCDGNKSPLTVVWKKSPGYRSPKLIQPRSSVSHQTSSDTHRNTDKYSPSSGSLKLDKSDEVFQSKFKDMESALQDVFQVSEKKLASEYSHDQLKLLAGERESVPLDQWNALIDYYQEQTNYYKKRLEVDHTLITKVLEVNNELYSRCEFYQAENEKLKQLLHIEDEWSVNTEDGPYEIQEVYPCSGSRSNGEQYGPGSRDTLTSPEPHRHEKSQSPPPTAVSHQQLFSPVDREPGTFSTTRSQTSASVVYEEPDSTTIAFPGAAVGTSAEIYKKVFHSFDGATSFF